MGSKCPTSSVHWVDLRRHERTERQRHGFVRRSAANSPATRAVPAPRRSPSGTRSGASHCTTRNSLTPREDRSPSGRRECSAQVTSAQRGSPSSRQRARKASAETADTGREPTGGLPGRCRVIRTVSRSQRAGPDAKVRAPRPGPARCETCVEDEQRDERTRRRRRRG